MDLKLNFLMLVFALIFTTLVMSKPLEEPRTEVKEEEFEVLETAEAQHPFMPRFAMKRFKERREEAARRNKTAGGRVVCPQPCVRPVRRQ